MVIEKQLTQRILEFLESHPEQCFSKSELQEIFPKDSERVRKKITLLLKHNEIKSEKISVKVARKLYGMNLKRGLRVYSCL